MAGKRKATANAGTGRSPGRARAAARSAGAATRSTGSANRRGRAAKKQRTLGGRVRRALLYLVVAGVVGLLVAGAGFAYLYNTTELPDPNADFKTETSFVYYSDGKTELGRYAVQNRDAIPYAEMPQDIKDAVVAAENRSFWSDSGIDIKGIVRAVFNNAQGNATQGASTITQQYIKILYLSQERSYERKLKEAILSLKLGRQVSKREILEGYLNTIYFGRGAYGIQAAALAYFQKPAAELTLKESAALASVINNPTGFDPANGRDAKLALRERYAYVLGGMAQSGHISAEDAEKAAKRLPKFPPAEAESTYGGQKGHVLTMVRSELLALKDENGDPLLDEDQIDGGGLKVTTTFTKKAMDAAEQGVDEVRPRGPELDRDLHAGVASVEVDTGAVRGIYGGQDYLDSQINWAVAGGMAGSSLKPFALTAGIKAGFSLKDTFSGNSPYELPDGSGEVENQGDTSYGSAVNLIQATEDSINTAYVDLTVSIPEGPEQVVETMNAMGIPPAKAPRKKAYGIPDSSPGLEPFAGVALGSATVSPINMANAYATIANDGRFHAPYVIEKVIDANGEVVYDHSVSDQQVIDPEQGADIAADVSYAMQQVVQAGSGTVALGLERPAAGKTGTATVSNGDVSSSWFTGFTPQLSTSVMYVRGNGTGKLDGWLPPSDDGRDGYFGGNYPAKTWTEIMRAAMEGVDPEDFPEPVFVDGDAPDEGHSPTTPPPPPPPTQGSPRPPSPDQDDDEPTKSPTTIDPPTEPPASDPPPSTIPPTTAPSPPPSTTAPPSPTCDSPGCGSPTPTVTASATRTLAARAVEGRAWWGWMRW